MGNEKSVILKIPETIRHLSFQTDNFELVKEIGRFKNLRTLLITYCNQSFVDALEEMLNVTGSIRLLHIKDRLQVIPKNIGYLHHLRYLWFPVSDIKLLPNSLSSLYHLQFLIIDKNKARSIFSNFFFTLDIKLCSNDCFLSDIKNLSNLRYLSCPRLEFPGIGKLKFLQQLIKFEVKNETGYRIAELEHMNELLILGVTNLKVVRDAEEAHNAKLCDMRKLAHLSLEWDTSLFSSRRDIGDLNLDESVLDKLQPHNYLKTLHIINYMGARSAIWMNKSHLINNLVEINLFDCLEWEILPPFGQLPLLKILWLRNMPKVKRIENKFDENHMSSVFPSLHTLNFENLEALVDWFDGSVVDSLFPCLTELSLSNCPNLQELLYLPPKLKSLKINNIGWKALNYCNFSKSVPLETLKVRQCRNITSISLASDHEKIAYQRM